MYKIKKENTKVEIELTVDNSEWEQGVERVYEASKSKFNIVGFRKGHAPRKVIEQQYGDSVFFEDTVEYFVNTTLDDVLYKNPELEPVTQPQTKFNSFTADKGLDMTISFEIVPEFKTPDLKDVEIEVHDSKVTDEELEHYIHHLLEDNATFESVDREVKNGDSAVIDFTGYMDDKAFEGGAGQDYPLEIGSHTFIDTFEDQLIGHKKDEEVDVNVTFPENYQASEFAGKKALFKVVIKDVREKHLPTLDDKFVADTTEFETVDAYRKATLAHIQDMKNKQADDEIQYNIREYLLKNTEIQIPEEYVEANIQGELQRMRNALAPYNVTLEDYLTQTGSNIEDYMKNAREKTLRGIKTRYIYRNLIEKYKISVSAKELDEATANLKDDHDKIRKENELLLNKLYEKMKKEVKLKVVND